MLILLHYLRRTEDTLLAWSRCFTDSLAWRGWCFWSYVCRMMPLSHDATEQHQSGCEGGWWRKLISGKQKAGAMWSWGGRWLMPALWCLLCGLWQEEVFVLGQCSCTGQDCQFSHCWSTAVLTELLISEVPSWKRATVVSSGSEWHADF